MIKNAFFDFDETVIGMKTMFSFLEYGCAQGAIGGPRRSYQEIESHMEFLAQQGTPRAEINRFYYRLFAGMRVSSLRNLAGDWFRTCCVRGIPLLDWTSVEFARLTSAGTEIVVVSGSFRELIEPFALMLGISAILCAELEQRDGHLTGELVGEPMIGQGKARAVRKYMQANTQTADDCVAYGDHMSDVFMLGEARRATVVNPNAELTAYALQRQWNVVISGTKICRPRDKSFSDPS